MVFSVKEILQLEVTPALGCTEPVAIALGSAAAASLLPGRQIDQIEIWVDPNIYKNGMAVAETWRRQLSRAATSSLGRPDRGARW